MNNKEPGIRIVDDIYGEPATEFEDLCYTGEPILSRWFGSRPAVGESTFRAVCLPPFGGSIVFRTYRAAKHFRDELPFSHLDDLRDIFRRITDLPGQGADCRLLVA